MRYCAFVLALLLPICGYSTLFFGPEIYHLDRNKEGGEDQNGTLIGGRLRYERIAPCCIYWGVDSFYATGILWGNKDHRSRAHDAQIEGRLGYTLCFPRCRHLLVSPYAAYGYFQGINKLKHPKSVRFRNSFQYGAIGFCTELPCTSTSRIGFRFKAKFSNNGVCKIEDHSLKKTIHLDIDNSFHYEVELPFNYVWCICDAAWDLTFEPFYRFRHYGGRATTLKNKQVIIFRDTEFRSYGGRLLLSSSF